ncbi:MAG: hypothetical protein WBN66_06305 [Smithella sp.]
MKLYVYQCGDHVTFYNQKRDSAYHEYLGELDLDIQQPKKTVRKEVNVDFDSCDMVLNQIPLQAKNMKISYEVEE